MKEVKEFKYLGAILCKKKYKREAWKGVIGEKERKTQTDHKEAEENYK